MTEEIDISEIKYSPVTEVTTSHKSHKLFIILVTIITTLMVSVIATHLLYYSDSTYVVSNYQECIQLKNSSIEEPEFPNRYNKCISPSGLSFTSNEPNPNIANNQKTTISPLKPTEPPDKYWLTYSNDVFSFKYPEDMIFENQDDKIITVTATNPNYFINEKPIFVTFELSQQQYNTAEQFAQAKFEEIKSTGSGVVNERRPFTNRFTVNYDDEAIEHEFIKQVGQYNFVEITSNQPHQHQSGSLRDVIGQSVYIEVTPYEISSDNTLLTEGWKLFSNSDVSFNIPPEMRFSQDPLQKFRRSDDEFPVTQGDSVHFFDNQAMLDEYINCNLTGRKQHEEYERTGELPDKFVDWEGECEFNYMTFTFNKVDLVNKSIIPEEDIEYFSTKQLLTDEQNRQWWVFQGGGYGPSHFYTGYLIRGKEVDAIVNLHFNNVGSEYNSIVDREKINGLVYNILSSFE